MRGTQKLSQYLALFCMVVGMLFSFQNCAQQTYGSSQAEGSSENPSAQAVAGLKVQLVLVDHETPVVNSGERVTLTVNFEAVGADQYLWERVSPFKGTEVISTTTTPQLVFEAFRVANQGEYKVVAVYGEDKVESDTLAILVQ